MSKNGNDGINKLKALINANPENMLTSAFNLDVVEYQLILEAMKLVVDHGTVPVIHEIGHKVDQEGVNRITYRVWVDYIANRDMYKDMVLDDIRPYLEKYVIETNNLKV